MAFFLLWDYNIFRETNYIRTAGYSKQLPCGLALGVLGIIPFTFGVPVLAGGLKSGGCPIGSQAFRLDGIPGLQGFVIRMRLIAFRDNSMDAAGDLDF